MPIHVDDVNVDHDNADRCVGRPIWNATASRSVRRLVYLSRQRYRTLSISAAVMLACRGVIPTPSFTGCFITASSISWIGMNFYIRLKFYRAFVYVDELTPAHHTAQLHDNCLTDRVFTVDSRGLAVY